jgi:replicative superfamily II helicase
MTALLARQRVDSIWVAASRMGPKVDQLLRVLVEAGRQQPIFTLLPSQHEALRSRLLDPAQVAVVLQMPTSAGKTLLAELAIAQVYGAYGSGARIAYVTPTRALCTQVRRSLQEDLGPIGIPVSAAGGAFEDDPYELDLLQETDGVVVSTPEKLDLLLRAHPDWAAGLRLVVVDEAHTLHERGRGARLELLLANLRREQPQARLLLLTPFIENAKQIAEWLGEDRATPIAVHWRPSRLLLGVPTFSGRGAVRRCTIAWVEPHRDGEGPPSLTFAVEGKAGSTARGRVVRLAQHFQEHGTVLGMFAGSRVEAEEAAQEAQASAPRLSSLSPALRVAIASAEEELGAESLLADCLRHGIAWHHSALSPLLRYLIEDQVRAGNIRFIAATTTLAQGMNFPVASVLIHSVNKPEGGGRLSATEFWNIAGRAGRVGLADEGLVVFANEKAEETRNQYRRHLNAAVVSALLQALDQGIPEDPKEAYQQVEELRPFLQFVAHAVVTLGYRQAVDQFEETLQASLAFYAAGSRERSSSATSRPACWRWPTSRASGASPSTTSTPLFAATACWRPGLALCCAVALTGSPTSSTP